MNPLKAFSDQVFPNTPLYTRIADRICACEELTDRVQANAAIVNLLAEAGAKRLAEGRELVLAAHQALLGCQTALDAQYQAGETFDQRHAAARQAFCDYRHAALPLVPDGAQRFELGLDVRLPDDGPQLISVARSAYKVALNTPTYLARLKEAGAAFDLFEAGCAAFKALLAADKAYEAAKAVAIDAIVEYELTNSRLQEWEKRFRRTLKSTLKEQPGLAATLSG